MFLHLKSKKRNKSRFSVLTGAAVELLLTVPPLALQVLHRDGGAPVPCQLTFAKVANNTLSRVVQSEMLPNLGGLSSHCLSTSAMLKKSSCTLPLLRSPAGGNDLRYTALRSTLPLRCLIAVQVR